MREIGIKTELPFMKMHGLGNDFVVIDQRDTEIVVAPDLARAIGHRNFGVGFDQLAVIGNCDAADLELTFFNADGSKAGACGNATRCIANYEMARTHRSELLLQTERGVLNAVRRQDGVTSVNMGQPLLSWNDIPLAREIDTLALPIDGQPVATGMGNPHCSFFVDNVETIDLAQFGASHEHHSLFPERTNVQIAQVISQDRIRVRVWERGVGVTLASGSSSCAVAVAAHRRGLTCRSVHIDLDGGTLEIDWREDGVWMAGPTAHVFDGIWKG